MMNVGQYIIETSIHLIDMEYDWQFASGSEIKNHLETSDPELMAITQT